MLTGETFYVILRQGIMYSKNEKNQSFIITKETEAIRRSSHEQAKTIPIITMTANAFSEDMQHSLAAGMNAHISKPVDMKLLKKTIRNIKLGREEAQFIDQ